MSLSPKLRARLRHSASVPMVRSPQQARADLKRRLIGLATTTTKSTKSKPRSYCEMTCGNCGHVDDLESFCTTPITGDLPRNEYQCPKCRHAFRKSFGKPTVYASGFVMPGPVSLVPVGAKL